MYPPSGLWTGARTEDYIHCDGMQLKLADSDLGSEQYRSSDYYVWNAGTRNEQLLFILSARVNLTTITLHYYSDSVQGLSKLRLLSVPEDFNIWDTLTASANSGSPVVTAAPPGGEPAGRRNVSINVNFNTKRVLIYKVRNNFQFAVSDSEV